MPQMRQKYDPVVRWTGLCRVVEETKKPVAAVAGELGVNEGTGGNWVARAQVRRAWANPGYEELKRLRAENAELRTGA